MSGFLLGGPRLRVDAAALRGWAARVGRPARPGGAEADEVIARAGDVNAAWEGLLLRGLVPAHWRDGARFLTRPPPEGGPPEDPPVLRTPASKAALRDLSGDPEAAARAEALVEEAAEASDVWASRAGAARLGPQAFEAPVWTRVDRERALASRARVRPGSIPLSAFFALRQTMIDRHLAEHDAIRADVAGALPEAPAEVVALAQASIWSDLLRRRGGAIGDGVASGLGGVPLADLPDLCGPVVDLMATGYLWVRGNGWAWSGWPPVLAALQVG